MINASRFGFWSAVLTSVVAAAVFAGGGRLERALRWLWVTSFVLAVRSLVGLPLIYGKDLGWAFEVTVLTVNWVVLIVSGALLSVIFRRTELDVHRGR